MQLEGFKKVIRPRPIGVRFAETYGNVQPYYHWHPYYEILVIKRGSYTINCNKIEYSSDRPAVIIHRPYGLHSLNADESILYTRYVIHISVNMIKQFSPNLLNMSDFVNASMLRADPSEAELDEISFLADAMAKCGHEYSQSVDLSQSSFYAALIMYKAIKICHDGRGEIYMSKFSYIQDVLQLVYENLSEPLTVADLCERFGVSHAKLTNDFKTVTGSTYKKYVTEMRQTYARELLLTGTSLTDTSLEVGYSSEAHFVAAFRDFWGITPGEYMRNHAKQK